MPSKRPANGAGMSKAQALLKSKKARNDEFYTLYQDIADELPLHRELLRGKRIICPCDWDGSFMEALAYKGEGLAPANGGQARRIDVERSRDRMERNSDAARCNFVKFLVSHAGGYGIKAVSASGYDPLSMRGVKFQDIDYAKYDLVITNPPFSLFREFIETMFGNKLKFLIIGPANAMAYKDVFSHVMNNEMWLGYHHHLTGFALPDGTVLPKNDALVRYCCWYTNLDASCRHNGLVLTEKYDPRKNPAYCNFDGIDVGKTLEIPYDYQGSMGVPLTFMQKYNPGQFEILGSSGTLAGPAPEDLPKELRGGPAFYLRNPDGGYRRLFFKIAIRNRAPRGDGG
jgi:hypothetical protein